MTFSPILTPTNPLHLLRALLRECTYLPDPNARIYFHNYVLHSYRQHLPKDKRRPRIPLMRQVSLLDRGRKTFSLLCRANQGYIKPLDKVLMHTYGRSGRRRRLLMEKFMAPDVPQNNDELGKLSLSAKYAPDWKPPSAVHALIQSQSQQRHQLEKMRSTKIQAKLKLPEKNIWGKPLGDNRIANMTRAWYAKQTDKLYPPLPQQEREELYALASGEKEWHPTPRRIRVGGSASSGAGNNLPEVLLDGPEQGQRFKPWVKGRPHQLTARLMRRLWTSIYKHTPKMAYDDEKKRRQVIWDDVVRETPAVVVPSRIHQAMLFGNLS